MPLSKLTHERYAHAADLTDAEVDELYEYYKGLKVAFGGYTPREYLLVENNVHDNYVRLSELKELRKADKPKVTKHKSKMDHAIELFIFNPTNRDRFTEQWVERGLPLSHAFTYFSNLLNASGHTLVLIDKAKAAAFDALEEKE